MNAPPKLPRETLDGLKILIVEDDPTSLYMMKVILTKLNAGVSTAENGLIAIETLSKETFDLVMMDVNMPEMDGLTAVAELRKRNVLNRQGQPLSIIALTAYAMSGDKERCLQAGMTDYISKPVAYELLTEKIHEYWNPDSVEVEEPEVVSDLLVFEAPNNQFEIIEALKQASGLDDETCFFVLRTYVDQSKELIAAIREGLVGQGADDLGILLHKLKGSSGNVRANRIMTLALQSEEAYKKNDIQKIKTLLPEIEAMLLALEGQLDQSIL